MKISLRLFITAIISLFCVGCDQASKQYAAHYLPEDHMQSYLYDIVRIGYTENTGAFLGMGSNLSPEHRFWLFSVFAGLLLAGLFAYLLFHKPASAVSIAGFALILSGGGSNLYDRLINNGAVIDFLNVGFSSLRTGIFNVADMAIMAGAVLVVFAGSNSGKSDSPDQLEHNSH